MDRLEQLKMYMDVGKYEAAVALLPDIRDGKAKNATEMMLLAHAYGKCADFEHAEKLFKKAYKRRPSKLLYKDMIEISLECGRMDAAEEYYSLYSEFAADEYSLLVYRFKIEKKKGSDPDTLIECLKNITEYEYTPEWAYELAKYYHKSGKKAECIAELERIASSFDAEMPVAVKAKTLLSYYRGEISAEEIVAKKKAKETEIHEAAVASTNTVVQASTQDEAEDDDDEDEDEDGEYENTGEVLNEDNWIGRGSVMVVTPDIEESSAAHPELFGKIGSSEDEEEKESEDSEHMEAASETVFEASSETQDDSDINELFVPAEMIYDPGNVEITDEAFDQKAKKILSESGADIKGVLKNYYRIGEIRSQIVKSINLACATRNRIMLCVTGEKGTGRSAFAKRMVQLFSEMGLLKNDTLAVIDATKLNVLPNGTATTVLSDFNILVENAGDLSAEKIGDLIKAASDIKAETCIILEDTSRNMNVLLRSREEIQRLANNRIHLPKYDTEELFGFAVDVAESEDYKLTVPVAEQLKDFLSSRKINDSEKFGTLMQIMKKAVDNADRRYAPVILKMAAEAAFKPCGDMVIDEGDIALPSPV